MGTGIPERALISPHPLIRAGYGNGPGQGRFQPLGSLSSETASHAALLGIRPGSFSSFPGNGGRGRTTTPTDKHKGLPSPSYGRCGQARFGNCRQYGSRPGGLGRQNKTANSRTAALKRFMFIRNGSGIIAPPSPGIGGWNERATGFAAPEDS